MSVMIQECTERLVTKLNEIAENEGKLDAKRLVASNNKTA